MSKKLLSNWLKCINNLLKVKEENAKVSENIVNNQKLATRQADFSQAEENEKLKFVLQLDN